MKTTTAIRTETKNVWLQRTTSNYEDYNCNNDWNKECLIAKDNELSDGQSASLDVGILAKESTEDDAEVGHMKYKYLCL